MPITAITGLARQREIYLTGVANIRPHVPADFATLEQLDKAVCVPNDSLTSPTALEHWRIVPRVLRDVSHRDLSVTLFGQRLPTPFLLAPIDVLEMAHHDADLAVARAAQRLGIPFIFSNQASVSMERCAAVMGDSPRWFQLYWSRSDQLVSSFVRRAEQSGYNVADGDIPRPYQPRVSDPYRTRPTP